MTTPAPGLVPAEAITAARNAITARYTAEHGEPPDTLETILIQRIATAALEAAAPAILAADQERRAAKSHVVKIDGELTEEAMEQLRRDFLAAADSGQLTVLPSRRLEDRIAQLEQLATDMLSRYTKTDDGHRARAGQVQIARWQAILRGDA